MQLIFEQVRVGGDRNFGYLLGDRDAGLGVLIDPSYSPAVLAARAHDQHLRISYIFNTHSHPDHTNGNAEAHTLTGAPIAAHGLAPTSPDVRLSDGQVLEVGALRLHLLHVPGHSPDHVVIHEPDYGILLTGDLLFVGKVGGTTDDADARTEFQSLRRLLARVSDDTTIWPGHDYGARPSSTMAWEHRTNPFLLCDTEEAFLAMKSEWPAYKQRLGLK